MEKWTWNLLLICCFIFLDACNNKTMLTFEESKLAPQAVRLLNELNTENKRKNFTPSAGLVQRYGLKEDNGVYFVGGLMQLETGFDETMLTELEVKQRKNTGTIRTVSIPVMNLGKLSQLPKIKYIEIDQSLKNR